MDWDEQVQKAYEDEEVVKIEIVLEMHGIK